MNTCLYYLIQDASEHLYWYNNIIIGMESCAGRYDYVLRELTESAKRYVSAGQIVFVIGADEEWVLSQCRYLWAHHLTPILLNSCMPRKLPRPVSGIFFELEEAVSACLQYLKHCGRKRIFLLGLHRGSAADKLKEESYLAFLGENNLVGEAIFCDTTLEQCVTEFVNHTVFEPDDAVLCSNDTTVLWLLNDSRIKEMDIPSDLFVIVMGNSILGQRGNLSLTTVEFDYTEIGRQAIKLVRLLGSEPIACTVRISLPCKLIIRDSTANIPLPTQNSQITDAETDLRDDRYFAGTSIRDIIGLESFLQQCDDIDRRIIRHLWDGLSYEQIAEEISMTDRAVRYRINALCHRFGCKGGTELRAQLKNIL